MRATSFLGPDRPEQEYPLTDAAEVREARDLLGEFIRQCAEDCINGPEQYDSHEEYMAARDRELWGDAPFEED